MQKLKSLVNAARPKTLPASVGPVLLGLALTGDQLSGKWHLAGLVAACAILLQISANLVNDYYDHKNKVDGKNRLGPDRMSATGALTTTEVRNAFIASLGLALVIGAYLVASSGLPIAVIGALSLIFAYIYTGGPYPLSYRGLGELLALIFFGPVAVWGTWYIITESYSSLPIIAGFGPGFIALSIMAINNMRDRLSDKQSGKTTLAVLLGEKKSRLIPIIGIALSALIPVFLALHYRTAIILIACLSFLPFLTTWKRIIYAPIDKSQNLSLAETGKYLLFYCMILSLSIYLGT